MTPSTKKRSIPRKRRAPDPLEQDIEAALAPGDFISYNAAWSFVDDVRDVADRVSKLIKREPERAVRLYQTFVAACHLKAEEIDDSSGSFGMLVDDLFQGWIKARQAAGAAPEETARVLVAWMEDDPYGFCYDLDREASKVLDKKGLAAFAAQIRSKFEGAPAQDDEEERSPGRARRRWGAALKTVLAAARDIEAFVTLCEQTGLGDEDCKSIAEMYKRRKRPADALSWVERGLKIAKSCGGYSSAEHDLQDMKRELLSRLGRAEDALASAWAEFEEHPSVFTYEELLRYVPTRQKKAWHAKAMQAAEGADLSSQIELWLEHNELDLLVARLHTATDEELEEQSHFRTEPLARKLERSHPELAARVYRALGMRIVNAGKSKYYRAALDNLKNAKKYYTKAGLVGDWEAFADEVRERHHRKKGFMARFEDTASGTVKPPQPTFLDRARRRWPKQSG